MGNCLFLHARGWGIDRQMRTKLQIPRGMPGGGMVTGRIEPCISMTEKHKNPTNVPILKKFHRGEHAQLAFENASRLTFFLHVTKIKILQVTGLRMLMISFAWTSVDSTRVSGRKAFLKLFFPKNNIFLDNCFPLL